MGSPPSGLNGTKSGAFPLSIPPAVGRSPKTDTLWRDKKSAVSILADIDRHLHMRDLGISLALRAELFARQGPPRGHPL